MLRKIIPYFLTTVFFGLIALFIVLTYPSRDNFQLSIYLPYTETIFLGFFSTVFIGVISLLLSLVFGFFTIFNV
jgi:hypothetical protein